MNRKGGQPGNQNAAKNKIWADAVRREALQGDRLRNVARALFAAAEAGDIAAIREIGDRIDGKVSQAVTGADGGPLVIQWESADG